MLLLFQASTGQLPPDQILPDSVWSGYFQTLGALVLVLVLLVVVMRYVLPSLPVARGSASGLLRVRGSIALEPRKRIYLIETGGKVLMVSSCENSLGLLGTFDATGFPEVPAEDKPESSFSRLLKRRQS